MKRSRDPEKLKLRKETLKTLSKEELSKVPGAGSRWIGGKYYPCQQTYH